MRDIYNAIFTLGSEGKTPDLERMIDFSKEWVSRLIPEKELETFNETGLVDLGKRRLQTIRLIDKEKDHFAFTLRTPDRTNSDLCWEVKAAFSEKENGEFSTNISLANGWFNKRVSPVKYDLTRPALVPILIDHFGAHEKYPLKAHATTVITNEDRKAQEIRAKEVVSMIQDKERMLPLVFISANNFADRPEVDPKTIARELAGIAYVMAAKDRWPTFALEKLMGKSMSCYDGAVRLYWPVQGNESSSSHPYWTRDSDAVKRKFLNKELLKAITTFTLSRNPETSFEYIRRIELSQRIENLQTEEDLGQIVELYSAENEGLKEQIEESEQEKKVYLSKIGFLEHRVSDLESSLSACKEGTEKEEDLTPTITSTADAVTEFQKMYPGSNIVFMPRAERMAKNNCYQNPEQIFRAFEWLATRYSDLRMGNGESEPLEESCKTNTGMEYCATQPEATMSRFREDYRIDWGNKKVFLEEHLKKGTSREESKTIRIAFFYDKANEQVVVGYIGQHQKSAKS